MEKEVMLKKILKQRMISAFDMGKIAGWGLAHPSMETRERAAFLEVVFRKTVGLSVHRALKGK